MQVLYPLMYLIYSLKRYSMYWTDLFERYVENGRQNVCGHYSQKVPSLSLPSSPRWWCVCWWVSRMWDWAPNPPLPKRLTAAPVRIKPVPRSLLSINSAIVDLQFVFLHWHICVLCSYVFACFPDQTNKIPLSLFAPFRWTKIVWEVFFSFYYLTLTIRFVLHFYVLHEYRSWMRHFSLHINHIYLASFLKTRFWHFLVIRFWHFSSHCYYSLDLKSWSF